MPLAGVLSSFGADTGRAVASLPWWLRHRELCLSGTFYPLPGLRKEERHPFGFLSSFGADTGRAVASLPWWLRHRELCLSGTFYPLPGLRKEERHPFGFLSSFGADTGIRTRDLVLTKDVLYLLSHISINMLYPYLVLSVPRGPRPACRDYKSRPLRLQKQHCCFCLTRRAKDVPLPLSRISINMLYPYLVLSVPRGPRPACRDYKSRPLRLQKQHCCFCLTRRAKDVPLPPDRIA